MKDMGETIIEAAGPVTSSKRTLETCYSCNQATSSTTTIPAYFY